jgi:hypothetical protein
MQGPRSAGIDAHRCSCSLPRALTLLAWATQDPGAEQQILQLNRACKRQGVPPVQENVQLQPAARVHSQLIASGQKLSHHLPGEPILRKRLAIAGVHFPQMVRPARFFPDLRNAKADYMESELYPPLCLEISQTYVGPLWSSITNVSAYCTSRFARDFSVAPPSNRPRINVRFNTSASALSQSSTEWPAYLPRFSYN